ncbi:serine hydrolase domain-containing protein, partial [Bacteroidota bacterium]
VYRVGSVSKLFTATAIMQLVEEGKVDLDKTIDHYIPGFTIKSHFDLPGPITVRSLLTHESGLPSDYYYNFFFDNPPPDDYAKEYLNLPEQIKDEYVATQPWYNFSYCNLGFSLLGNIITNVSGKDYSDYIAENILDPLGMSNSSVILDSRVKENMSLGYFGKKEVHTPYIRDLAAGSLLSSVSDISYFMKMIFSAGTYSENTILQEDVLNSMFERQNGNVKLDLDFGIGITYWLENPLKIENIQPVSHGGDLPPYHAMFMVIPEYKLGAVALSNSNSSAGAVRDVVVNILQKALEAKAGIKITEQEDVEKEYLSLNHDQLNKYTGHYATPIGLLNFERKRNSIIARQSVIKVKLLPYKENEFDIKIKALGIPVAKDDVKKINMKYQEVDDLELFAVNYEGSFIGYGQKIQAVEIPKLWKNRIGKYEIANVNYEDYSKIAQRFLMKSAAIKMDKKTGFLLVSLKMMGQSMLMPLNPINDNEAVNFGIGRSMGETLRVIEKDGEEVIMYSGYELKKIK